MKYSEFREYLKSNNFEMREDDEMIIADNQFKISKRVQCSVWFLMGFIECSYEYELFKKVIELAETPLNERGEEKKYYIRHRFINGWDNEKYVNYLKDDFIMLNDPYEESHYQTKFTKEEIEEIKRIYNTDLRDFELVEVEED